MITRETLVEQSVQDYVKAQLFDVRDYPPEQIDILDAFPHEPMEPGATIQLDKNKVALGFNFDDDGVQAELGSDLKTRSYTLEFFVFGKTPVWARNLANAIKFAADMDGVIPLLDYSDLNKPVIDHLVVEGTRTERQPIPHPTPWQENVWITFVVVEDTYHARLA